MQTTQLYKYLEHPVSSTLFSNPADGLSSFILPDTNLKHPTLYSP